MSASFLLQKKLQPMLKFQIEQRLKDLDWTLYKLAKEIASLRATRSGKPAYPAVRYHSAISKALTIPDQSKLETITEIVEALGGTVQISWNVLPDVKAKS